MGSRLARIALLLSQVHVAWLRPLQAQQLRFPDDSLRLRPMPEFAPGGRYGPRVPPEVVVQAWRDAVDRSVRASREARRHAWAFAARPDTAVAVTPRPPGPEVPPPAAPPPAAPNTFAALGRYADVGLDFRSRLELKLDRLKNERCTAFDVLSPGCRTGFPTPSIA